MNSLIVFILIFTAIALTVAGTFALLAFAQAQKAATARAVAETARAKATFEVEVAAKAAADARKKRDDENTKILVALSQQMAAGTLNVPGITRDGMLCLDPGCPIHGAPKKQ